MGFTTDERAVRVDFFKPSGKWYTTEAVIWVAGYRHSDIHEAFARSLRNALGPRLEGMIAVCLEPFSDIAHPLMLSDWRIKG